MSATAHGAEPVEIATDPIGRLPVDTIALCPLTEGATIRYLIRVGESPATGCRATAADCSCDDPTMANRSEIAVEPSVHIKWAAAVADHDYAAADAYLSLKLSDDDVAKAIRRLRKATLTSRRANDILRAAGLTAAPLDDPGVMKDLIKVVEGEPLSPVLVLSGKKGADIADGFHRVSLVYRLDPYAVIPLKIA